MSTLCIIPARGGSKRLPGKNIRPFAGRPMLAWSIAAARESRLFDSVLVSTDDEEIAAVARDNGAEVPFLRPAELADDFTPTIPVVEHALQWHEANRGPVVTACCLYATAPFVSAEFLRAGYEQLQQHPEAEFAVSVTAFSFPVFRSLKLGAEGRIAMFWPENELTRSQDLPAAYHDAGQFYWGRRPAFASRRGFFNGVTYPVILPQHLVQDIDNEEDWTLAEWKYQRLQALAL